MSFILRQHSRVFGLRETHYFGELWAPSDSNESLSQEQLTNAVAVLNARQSRGVFGEGPSQEEYAEAKSIVNALDASEKTGANLYTKIVGGFAAQAGKDIVCEQTPRNILYAKMLLKIYPNAQIIHMVRDPRAVLASQKKRWKRRQFSPDKISARHSIRVWANYHPFTMSRLWNKASTAALAIADDPRVNLLRFEDLLNSPEESVKQLCNFLDIEFEPAMLEVGQVNSSHKSSAEAKKGINKQALESWRSILSKGEVAISERISGPVMEKFGYQKDVNGSSLLSTMKCWLSYPIHVLGVLVTNPHRAWIQLRALKKA